MSKIAKWLKAFIRLHILQDEVCQLQKYTDAPGKSRMTIKYSIAASEYIKSRLISDGVPLKNTKVIYYGVKCDEYDKRLRGDSNDCRLLYVGRLDASKGVHTILEAMCSIGVDRLKEKGITLSIVGDGHKIYVDKLNEIVQQSGIADTIMFTGKLTRKEIKNIYSKHDILICPSTWDEPYGIVLLEGMASQIPVIASGTGGSREILRDEFNCLLFPSNDARALASKIIRLNDDNALREKIIANAYLMVQNDMTFEKTLDQVEDYLNTILKD